MTNMSNHSVTSEQMYAIEENAHVHLGMKRLLMMENAGHGTADFILRQLDSSLKSKKIVAVCGSGNNGGDAFVACRHLAAAHLARIAVLLLTAPKEIRTPEAKINWRIISKMKSLKRITMENHHQSNLSRAIELEIEDADIILDGLLGTGVKGQIREPYSFAIDKINQSKAYTLAIDIPSGLDPNSGKPSNKCIKANATITFHRMKKGLNSSKKYTGSVQVQRIGIPPEAEEGVFT
jgi:NAD(P)H-hydrate epimerase